MPVKKTAKKTTTKKTNRKPPRKVITQVELVSLISEDTGYSATDVRHVLSSLNDVVAEQLAACEKVRIGQLVQLEAKEQKPRKARVGRNPRTGEPVKIAAKPASTAMKARVLKKAKDATPTLAKLRKAVG